MCSQLKYFYVIIVVFIASRTSVSHKTISSIWNTMIGSTLVALPSGFANSGYVFFYIHFHTHCHVAVYLNLYCHVAVYLNFIFAECVVRNQHFAGQWRGHRHGICLLLHLLTGTFLLGKVSHGGEIGCMNKSMKSFLCRQPRQKKRN